ncbi:Oxidoreductase-like protein [Cordyceps militaris CM01]|uniref:Oxidoreductase-like protein n=1 Tax=Cordyceps militaris (strain CM01) TaxID=983644 RepID=G3JIZ7_CORMM|nr:Oxidoreductase-like protein [Cordyceps militaris CM01]EGX91144.1 Oxidoreductase-like protein [Cordyceps militaris CM01]
MLAPSRFAPRVCRLCRRVSSPSARRAFSSATTPTPPPGEPTWPQRQPRGEYYDILLRDPTPYGASINKSDDASPLPSSPAAGSRPAKTYETISSRTAYSDSNSSTAAADRARVIFGSRLLGPAERAERAAGRQARATMVAGVRVPPRPEEPDNCCMSGCVNCVWDLFREDMEEWTLQSNEAKKRLAAAAAAAAGAAPPGEADGKTPPAVGDATIAKDMWTDDLFQNVPVGIREFMKQEKRLKEKHQREGTSGG